MAVADLWVQEKRANGEIKYFKVPGDKNPADMLTKLIAREEMKMMLANVGAEIGFITIGTLTKRTFEFRA